MDRYELGRATGIILFPLLVMLFKSFVLWQVRKWFPRAEYWLFTPLWPILRRCLRLPPKARRSA